MNNVMLFKIINYRNKLKNGKRNVNNHFFSAITIAFCVLISKATGVIRDIFFAKYLGSGIIGEAFYIAFRLPNTFRRMFADGAFSNVFVPFFSTKIKEDKSDALCFANSILLILTVFLCSTTLIIEIFMPELIALINPGFLKNKEKFDLAVVLSRISFPYIVFISISALFGSILNSIGNFWQFASISIILNITLILGLCLTNNFFSNTGFCLAWMMIIAGVIQVIILSFSCLYKKVFPIVYYKNNIKVQNRTDYGVRSFIKKLLPAIFSSGILQINIFVDGIFASFFVGAISHLYYTDRIGQFPLSLIGYSLSIAILPALSVAFRANNKESITSIQKDSINIAMFFAIPLTLLVITLGGPIIKLIYERGAFTSDDTMIVSNMIKIYAISIPFNILSKIFFVCFYAKKNTLTPLKISIFSLIFNIISNLILMNIFGRYCVIVSTTLSSAISTVITAVILKKTGNLAVNIKQFALSARVFLVSLISCCILPIIFNEIFSLNIVLLLFLCGCVHLILTVKAGILSKDFIKRVLLH